ncbi:hypothetical protein BGX29_010791 [Mortierella sp. GBA35]|nr:hypothetical protein BGX29_010791 [Mortierella sp. GBA35]
MHSTSHPSTTTSASTTAPTHATSATTTGATAAMAQAGHTHTHTATSHSGGGEFSTQVEPEILSHEQGPGFERTITQAPGEEPVHSIKLAGHIKGIPGRR